MNRTSVIVIGLPSAGKSTFIAALTYILKNQELPTVLKLDRLPEDMKYINGLVDLWLRSEPFERTTHGIHDLSFSLKTQSNQIGELVFPDISGELFEEHWAHREWDQHFASLVKNSEGLILFLHPKFVEKPFSISYQQKLSLVLDDEVEAQTTGTKPPETADPADVAKVPAKQAILWEPLYASSQAKLVDILQMIRSQVVDPEALRLGVVVSAWDLVTRETPDASPTSWVADYVPLLDQFLEMNPEQFIVRAYGVSGQGGDYFSEAEALRSIDEPGKKVKVVGPQCDEHDITAPLKWVLGLND